MFVLDIPVLHSSRKTQIKMCWELDQNIFNHSAESVANERRVSRERWLLRDYPVRTALQNNSLSQAAGIWCECIEIVRGSEWQLAASSGKTKTVYSISGQREYNKSRSAIFCSCKAFLTSIRFQSLSSNALIG